MSRARQSLKKRCKALKRRLALEPSAQLSAELRRLTLRRGLADVTRVSSGTYEVTLPENWKTP